MLDIKVARQTVYDLKVFGRDKLDAIKADNRLPTDEELDGLSIIEADVEAAASVVTQIEAAMDKERVFNVPDAARFEGGTPATDENGNPWKSFGHQLQAIATAYQPGGHADARLFLPDLHAAPTGAGTGQGGDGGFLVRSEFSSDIFSVAHQTAQLLGRCDRVPIGPDADGLEVPYVDETSRATGSRWGGVQVYRANEADSVTATKAKFGLMETRLEDLMGLAYATERLLRDAVALGAIMSKAFAEEFAFRVDDEIFRGSGAGECLGILNANATVSVAKETGQQADTIQVENITKMWSRMHARSRATAIWTINQDCEPTLYTMGVVVGTGGVPVYLPPNGIAGSPLASLMGRPVIPIEHASTIGDVGDICLLDLSQYSIIEKDGIDAADSMHVRFINNERTFRWVMRINGQPKWKSALTPYKGANTLSPFVTLANRA